jgi:hypothetical protein
MVSENSPGTDSIKAVVMIPVNRKFIRYSSITSVKICFHKNQNTESRHLFIMFRFTQLTGTICFALLLFLAYASDDVEVANIDPGSSDCGDSDNGTISEPYQSSGSEFIISSHSSDLNSTNSETSHVIPVIKNFTFYQEDKQINDSIPVSKVVRFTFNLSRKNCKSYFKCPLGNNYTGNNNKVQSAKIFGKFRRK